MIPIGAKYEDVIRILGQPDDEMKGTSDTWEIKPGGYYPNLENRYVSYWILEYNKYPGYSLEFNDKGVLKELGIRYWRVGNR